MNDLPLQIRVIDNIKVHNSECAYACCTEIKRQGRTEPTGANAQNFCGLKLELPFHANFGHDEVARIAQDLVVVQREGGGLSFG